MTKNQLEELRKLPKEDKIQLVQMLWDDIAKDQNFDDLPDEHKRLLEERLESIKMGKAAFKSWDDVKRKFERKD
ncbi:MAG TPA: addiction module protein [Bacteroidales bacterium]